MTYTDLMEHFKDDPEVYKNLQTNIPILFDHALEYSCLFETLLGSFNWKDSPQGMDYWKNVAYTISSL